MTYDDDKALGIMVWCRTCQHTHIAGIPSVTYACGPRCGFGVWSQTLAVEHATEYPDHLVHAVTHETVPAADLPPRPAMIEPSGVVGMPEGWSEVVGDEPGGLVSAGWTADGRFHQYVPTEDLTRTLITALQEAYHD